MFSVDKNDEDEVPMRAVVRYRPVGEPPLSCCCAANPQRCAIVRVVALLAAGVHRGPVVELPGCKRRRWVVEGGGGGRYKTEVIQYTKLSK